MDQDLYEIKLNYLTKARELVRTGQEHTAYVVMGVSREAATQLKRMSNKRLKQLAASGLLSFSMRFPPQFWRDMGEEDPDGPLGESLHIQLLMSGSSGEENEKSGLQA